MPASCPAPDCDYWAGAACCADDCPGAVLEADAGSLRPDFQPLNLVSHDRGATHV